MKPLVLIANEISEYPSVQNFEYKIIPMITTTKLENLSIPNPLADEAVVFTSKNALWVLDEMEDFSNPIFVVGSSTAEKLSTDYGKSAQWVAKNAESLIKKLDTLPYNKFLYFSGNRRWSNLPNALSKEPNTLREIVVYTTSNIDKKVSERFQGIAFLSPSAVESFLANNQIPKNSIIFALGKSTATVLDDFQDRLVVAKEPTLESLFSTIEEHFNV